MLMEGMNQAIKYDTTKALHKQAFYSAQERHFQYGLIWLSMTGYGLVDSSFHEAGGANSRVWLPGLRDTDSARAAMGSGGGMLLACSICTPLVLVCLQRE